MVLLNAPIVKSDDPERVYACLRQRNPHVHGFEAPTGQGFFAETYGVTLAGSALTLTKTSGYSVYGPTADLLVVCMPLSGSQTLSIAPDERFSRDEVAVILPRDDFHSTLHSSFLGAGFITNRTQIIELARSVDVILPRIACEGGALGYRALSFRELTLGVMRTLSGVPATFLQSDNFVQRFMNSIQAAFISCFDQVSSGGASTARVRHAIEYIKGHIAEVPTAVDVARHVGCSLRTIEYAFRNESGLSIGKFVRRERLMAARQRLLRREEGDTVTVVALRFGFLHVGRFSSAYKECFGEYPSQTLGTRR